MKARVLTAALLIPIVLLAVATSAPWAVSAMAAAASVIGGIELARLLRATFPYISTLAAVSAMAALCAGKLSPPEVGALGGIAWVVGTAVLIATVAWTVPKTYIVCELGSWWVNGPLLCVVAMHQLIPSEHALDPRNAAIMLLLPIWAGDTAAIFVGRSFGRRLLAPSISPKKTIEGSVANLASCVAIAVPAGGWLGLPIWASLACGAAAGLLGQAGDLHESWLKRAAGVKDSGALLPGHGGLLDRIDSLLFASPAVFAILLLATRR